MPGPRRGTTPTEVYAAAPATPTQVVAGARGGEPATLPEDELLGVTLSGTYRVLRVLGRGGMGRVYEAQHTRIAGKRFAIKVLHQELAHRPDVRVRFQREAEAAATINHPNVVGVYDVDVAPNGCPYLVSELLQGCELGDYLEDRGRLPPAEAVAIVRQVCSALQAAHTHGVIHRDVKPRNVFLTGSPERPHVKVLDFGISRLQGEGAQTLTRTGVVLGTPSYMAPEQARGERVDHRIDLYATGAILYRALSGRLPFDRPDTMATLAAVMTEEPARLRALVPEVPPTLELVVQRAMARVADERYQQMDELNMALEPFDVLPITTRAPSSAPLTSQTGAAAARQAREALGARTRLVMLLVAAGLGGLLAVMSIIAAGIQLMRSGPVRELSGIEALLVVAGAVALLSTPMFLVVRKLVRDHWNNTAKVLEVLAAWRGPVLAGLAGSGLLALAARFVEPVLLGNSVGLLWPLWSVLIPMVGMLAALGVVVSQRADPTGPVGRWAEPRIFAIGAGGLSLLVLLALGLRAEPQHPQAQALPSMAPSGASTSKPAGRADNKPANRDDHTKPPPRDTVPSEAAEQLLVKLDVQAKRRDLDGALKTLRTLNQSAPSLMSKPRTRQLIESIAVFAYLSKGRYDKRMTTLLTREMGENGIDILFDIMVTRGGSTAARKAESLLADPKIEAKGSTDMRIAYVIRMSGSCKAKVALVSRAATEGGRLTLRELKALGACGGGGCCLSKGEETAVNNAMKLVASRVE